MYIEQVENNGNMTAINPSVSVSSIAEPGDYELVADNVLPFDNYKNNTLSTDNSDKDLKKIMEISSVELYSLRKVQCSESEEMISVNEDKMSGKRNEKLVPNDDDIAGKSFDNEFNESMDNREKIQAMTKEENELNSGEDPDFETDQLSSGFFENGLKSIFIRGSNDGEKCAKNTKDPRIFDLNKKIVKKRNEQTIKLKKKRALSFLDTLVSLLIVGPLVIGQWRGIWNMMDIYKEFFPEWMCFIFGTGLHVIFAIIRDRLHGRFVEKWRTYSPVGRFAYGIVRLTYTYIFCVACNAQWRGGWMIFTTYFGSNPWVVCILTLIFGGGLVCLRAFRNLLAPPFIIVIDVPDRVFQFPTRYNVNTRDWSLYILDCAFSVGVVGSLVVFVWRGVWVLFDLHLFPENREYSAIGSLVIGYIIVAVTFCLQPLMRYTCARLEGLARLLAADAFLLLSFLGTVNVWRGIWSVLDLWLLPDDIELSCWITHVGCFVFLVLLNCSNSILVRGVYIDAEEEEGRCVVFPCHYLRLFFKIERQKKEARRQNLVAASKEAQARNENNSKEVENETLLNCTNTIPAIIPTNPESLV